jgi:hypothetical protein
MTSAEAIGERHAEQWYGRVGSLIITSRSRYRQAVSALEEVSHDPEARRAFDRCLSRIVDNAPGTLTQPPKRRRRA